MAISQQFYGQIMSHGPTKFFLCFKDGSNVEVELPQSGDIKTKIDGKDTSLAAQFKRDVVDTDMLSVTKGVTFTFRDGSTLDAQLCLEAES